MGVKIQRPGEPGHPGGNHRIYVRVNYRGNRKSRVFNTMKAAEAYASKVESILKDADLGKADAGEVFEPSPTTVASKKPPAMTLGEYWAKWFALEHCGWKPRTATTYGRQFDTHLQSLAARPLAEIKRQEVKELVSSRLAHGNLQQAGKPMQPNSVKGILVPLRKCLQAAVDDGLIASNPAARIKVPCRKDRTKADSLERYTREELAQILQLALAQMPRWYPALLTAARTGLRVGEICGLRVEDLRFAERLVHVRRGISRRIEGTPKNGKYRRVDMSAQLATTLQEYVRGREIAANVAGREVSPWVFGSLVTGRPLCDEVLAKEVWPRLLKMVGARRLKFHALRHTFASLLIEQGEGLAYVRDQLGHASIQITVDMYGHLIPGANRAAVDRLDDRTPSPQEATGCNPDATLARMIA